ncbi:DMT family transporter [Actinomyces polynesiensis]|uniref:DMT family transporter n=1 Tax=Actinomyces polynesiensis TaxID=1325934 RepID=UPI00093AA9EB|nr:DMT family transporter [Actinomyces polynesiensis]
MLDRTPTWVLFSLSGLVWGASFLFIKIALGGMDPAQVVLARLGLGALALVTVAAVTRTPHIRDVRLIGHLVVAGFFWAGLPLLLFAWAGQYLPSGISAIFNATTPLMTLLITALVLPAERLGADRVTGVVIGAGGIVLVAAPWRLFGGSADFAMQAPAYLACLAATTCYAIAFTYIRRFVRPAGHGSLAVTTTQIVSAFVVMLLLSPLTGAWTHRVSLSLPIVVSLVLLGVFGTGLAYVWNMRTIETWGPVRASMVTYVTPIVGVVLGMVVLSEHLTWNEPIGMVVTFVGIALAQGLAGRLRGLSLPSGRSGALRAPVARVADPAPEGAGEGCA